MSVTVIIAARNEAERIGMAIDSAFAAGASEVIVADGASIDRTRELSAAHGARVIECSAMRSRQYNSAVSHAMNDSVIFLHGDTVLPAGAAAAVADALANGATFGGFRLRFAESTAGLRFTAFMINLRTSITLCPYGDQAQFISKGRFIAEGEFREIPIMEDYDLAVRMKRRGRSVLLPLTVTTTGRRFLRRGVARTWLLNWAIIVAWRLGVPAAVLAKWYGRGASR